MFPRSNTELTSCKEHLGETGAAGTPIERILVGYVLTVVHAEFELAVREAVRERCFVDGDDHLSAFISVAAERLVRSIRISELSGILGWFNESRKKSFQAAVNDTKAATFYDNIEANRQSLAHSVGSMATMIEIEEWFQEGTAVIVEFRRALGIR